MLIFLLIVKENIILLVGIFILYIMAAILNFKMAAIKIAHRLGIKLLNFYSSDRVVNFPSENFQEW